MSCHRQITRAAHLESLPAFRELIDIACQDEGNVAREVRDDIRLAVTEACQNIITHGYAGMDPGSIILSLTFDPRRVVIRITDFGHSFEPIEAPPPDVEAGLEDRPMGGFGLYLIHQTMDEVSYEVTEDGNCLTLVKRLFSSD